jgi:transposase-like protein
MSRKAKYSQEVKLEIVREYMKGDVSSTQLSRKYGCNEKTIRVWTAQYKSQGEDTLRAIDKNQTYSGEFKRMVVEEYLRGEIGSTPLAIKYKLRSKNQILNWLKLYNDHKKLKSYKTSGGIIMTKGRKTTYEERIEIVEDCLKNGQDYNATAKKHNVSYQQVYSWVGKYNAKGVTALKDNRGKGKALEDMDNVERLEAENKLLKAKLERLEIEVELKKKLEEMKMRLAYTTKKKK